MEIKATSRLHATEVDAITEDVFRGWNTSRQAEWLRKHPTSRFANFRAPTQPARSAPAAQTKVGTARKTQAPAQKSATQVSVDGALAAIRARIDSLEQKIRDAKDPGALRKIRAAIAKLKRDYVALSSYSNSPQRTTDETPVADFDIAVDIQTILNSNGLAAQIVDDGVMTDKDPKDFAKALDALQKQQYTVKQEDQSCAEVTKNSVQTYVYMVNTYDDSDEIEMQ